MEIKPPTQTPMTLVLQDGSSLLVAINSAGDLELTSYGALDSVTLTLGEVETRRLCGYAMTRLRHYKTTGSLCAQIVVAPEGPVSSEGFSGVDPREVRYGSSEVVYLLPSPTKKLHQGPSTNAPRPMAREHDQDQLEPADPKELQNDGDPIKAAALAPVQQVEDENTAALRAWVEDNIDGPEREAAMNLIDKGEA